MRNKTKKIIISIVLGVYLLTNLLQSALYRWNAVYAAWTSEDMLDYTNIVAIIVNDDIYDSIRGNIERYAKTYIQWAGNNKYTSISNSKALVFPINVDNFSAKDITQLLENIYFDWISWVPSKLVWVILIWDIPLPVVNQDWYIFPTIYPYVDFEEQKFIWDENSKYFIYNDNPNWQAEIWHGMINFDDNISDYVDYFSKLSWYVANPSNYIWKAIWYEDFIWNNKYFNDDSLNFYLNNFIFAEDLWYHRYSDLMIKVMQWQRNKEMAELMEWLNEVNTWEPYTGMDELASMTDNMDTPTMQIKAMLDNWYLSSYSSLFGQKYLKTITSNIETANRWTESRTWADWSTYYLNALDTVYKKAEINDEVALRTDWWVEPFIIMLNNALEEAVDKKVEEQKYWLDEVIPLTYLRYEWESRWLNKCVWNIYDAYENYYFWENAQYLQSMEETSPYRWTFRNYIWIDGLTISNIQDSENPSTDLANLDLNKKSIWWSYEIFATQVDANRWYNYNNSLEESEMYSGNKTAKIENWDVTCVKKFLWICFKRRWSIYRTNWSWCDLSEDWDQWWCEDPIEYAVRIWWWASPLNLTWDWWFGFARENEYSYTWATSPVFDIWWSKALPMNAPEYESNSFESVNEYTNLTLRRFSPKTNKKKFKAWNPLKKAPAPYGFWYDYSMDYEVKFANMIPRFNDNRIAFWQHTWVLTADDVDYFHTYNASATQEWNVIKINKQTASEPCQWAGEIYTYRTLDSRVKNDSVNADEVNGYTYSVFGDIRSHTKQFYDELFSYVDTVSGSVNAVVWSDSGSLKQNLLYIKRSVDSINEWFQNIIDYDLDDLDELTTWEVRLLAANWLNVFDASIASELFQKIKDAQNGVLDLSWFVDIWDTLFDGVIDFIAEQKRVFKVNWWDLIFLDSWKTDLLSTVKDILANYEKINLTIAEAGVLYEAINEIWKKDVLGIPTPLSMDVVDELEDLYDDLEDELNWSWCETKYQSLCSVVNTLIHTYERFADDINEEKDGINNIKVPEYDDDWDPTWDYDTIERIFWKLWRSAIFSSISSVTSLFTRALANPLAVIPVWPSDDPLTQLFIELNDIPVSDNAELLSVQPWMNVTTSDRPIDSPRYLTFKWIWWDKVTFIYPDLYKVEIFSWDSDNWLLKLKSPWEIKTAIQQYLKDVVNKYNDYLWNQLAKHNNYYNLHQDAYNKLDSLSKLANPHYVRDSVRPYALFDENYLINWVENSIRTSEFFSGEDLAKSDPILFIANMMYYQNLTWQVKTLSGTIQWDFDNQRMDFDINEKVSYLMDNYLIKDNNKWSFLTPDYRDSWYEVAYINSDWNDRILYENTPDFVEAVNTASSNYVLPTNTVNIQATTLEQELLNECNIPEDWWVLLFQWSGWRIETPWFDALKCRFEKITLKPMEFRLIFPFTRDTGTWFWNNVWNIFNIDEYEDIWKTYIEQLKLLDTDDINDEMLENMESSHPWDASKLWDVLSFTMIKAKKASIPANDANNEITISSSKQLWNLDFHIINVWESKLLLDWNNITVWMWWFSTWKKTFDPYNEKTLKLEFKDPVDWLNVILFYLCLPWTQNISNCVKKSVWINIVPWEVENLSIEMDENVVLEWASLPFKVKWTDKFWNEVWELISQRFETSSSSGNLTLNGVTAQSIKFSNFDKANFYLNATGGNLDRKTIEIQVSWSVDSGDSIKTIKVTGDVTVIKWRLDTYSGNIKLSSGSSILTWLTINLPDKDIYFTNWQPNSGTLPKISLKLMDKDGNVIKIGWKISVKTKNNLVSIWDISLKSSWNVASGYKFTKTNTFTLSSWLSTIYLSPNFSAGEDLIYISMPWVDDIQLPIYIKHASPKFVSLSADTNLIDTQSSVNANVKIFDNRENIIDDETVFINLWTADDKITLSQSGNTRVDWGSYDFNIFSHDKWWLWYVFATIHTGMVPIDKQMPDTLAITIQEKMLPESWLNVMYLNLFGSDWWNQWWYMSNNEKYSESLIKNSEKLITVTTQLLNMENIKYFPIVINNKLQIDNIIWNKITFSLNSGFLFDIKWIWTISANSSSFTLAEIDLQEGTIAQIEEIIDTRMSRSDRYKGKNVIFYIPEKTDSIITGNTATNSSISINGKTVFDINNFVFDQSITVSLSEEKIAWYQVWQLLYNDVLAWKLLIAVDNESWISVNLTSTSQDYWISEIWINWSSDEYWVWFYWLETSLPDKAFGYKSIQDSYDPMLWIWFTSDFKNITNFGWGMPVWEATLPFSSELLINIWDPLLKRVNGNETAKIYDESGAVKEDTQFDLGLWEVIYSEPGKEIHKVINIDFNNDGLEDIIVIFKDWTVKILKNYWGTNPFKNLWALTILADRISDVSIWDVDGNWYKDLIIWTESGWLRVYKNNWWIFDVDGYPVCINVNVNKWEVSEHPENVSWIHQIFLEDMDLDNALDIVTNDELWFIKIFYWGTTSWEANYLSTNKYMCDENWYNRVEWSSKIVYQFGIKIDSNSHILDQSLVRWKGISDTEWWDITTEDLWIDSNAFAWELTMDDMDAVLSNLSNFDVSAAEKLYMQNERFKQAWFGVIPIYEPDIENEADLDYVEIWALTWSDPVKIYKTYEDLNGNPIDWNIIDNTWSLVKWDLIRVTVYMIANDDFTWTFIDNIIGPWIIPLSEYDDEMFENFRFDSDYIDRWYITSWQIEDMASNIHFDLWNARYMIDNISMRRWNRLKFSYWLIYDDYRSFDIDVAAVNWNDYSGVVLPAENLSRYSNDNYPDISAQPTDWCNDSMFVFFNNKSETKRDYDQKFMDLARLMEEYNTNSEDIKNWMNDEVYGSMWNSASDWDAQWFMDKISEYAGWLLETIDWKWMLSSDWIDLSNAINLWIIDGISNDVVKKIDEAIWWMCNGIDLSSLWLWSMWWCGLPVPFNQAFLWVWKYHLFGCYNLDFLDELIWSGRPAMTFPGNRWPVYWVYLPFPWIFGYPFKWPGDWFVDFVPQNGTYPSMFRLYLMPTLTLKLGIAMCFWPYEIWKAIKDPVGSVVWNCIVFSVSLPCPNGSSSDKWANATTEIPHEYTLLKWCSKQNNPVYLWRNESSTPFVFGWSSSNSNSFQPIIPEGSYAWWFINIEIKPESTSAYKESSALDIDAIILEWWAKIQNQIQGSKEQWLIEKIVKQWLDKQIKYIMSNLSNFKVSIIWPDLESIFWKTSTVAVNNVKSDMDTNTVKKEKCEKNKGRWIENWASSYCEDTPASLKLKCENRWLKWNASDQTCTASDSALSKLDARWQKNVISRDQISSWSDYTNPFDKLAEAFSETPLINISTQDITVNVPMLTSDDITSYVSMSQTWVNRQSEILSKRWDFFKGLISFCSNWSISINWIDDLWNAINQLKEQYKDASYYSQWEDDKVLQDIQWKIDALQKLEKKYNLTELWDYKVYEAQDGGFYLYTTYSDAGEIVPYDVYLYFDTDDNKLDMFTSWFNLNTSSTAWKTKVSIERNGKKVSNEWLKIKKATQNVYHSCSSLFMDWTIDSFVNWFLNIQSNADTLIFSVKENIETLQQYKLFPLQLYEWIHVLEKYLWDISNLVNSILWTLSMWMETNANRYSQYIDAIITLMTVLETYQLIIDFSADWTESCSTCTNDNYDQFSCKLGKICDMLHIELPIFEIPPTKIPNIYLDFSEIHIETDIKLPSFTFNPVAVPLPELPNLPEPPSIDFTLNLDDSVEFGIDIVEQIKWVDLSLLSSINLWNIPLIPSPPTLPELPSFIPSLEMELPLLPPAPKIPKLPNTIQSTIKAAKIVGKILCIIKWKFGLVAENSIKAKVEQITQRDYEIPFRDNLDLTSSDWNIVKNAEIPSALATVFTWMAALLQTNQFKEAKLKWFDMSLQTYIDLHMSFDDFYAFVESVVWKINDYSYKLTNYVSEKIDYVSDVSKDIQDHLKACVNNPISIECNPNAEEINQYKELEENTTKIKAMLDTSFKWVGTALSTLERKRSEKEDLQFATDWLVEKLHENQELLNNYRQQFNQTNNDTDKVILSDKIEYTNKTVNNLQTEIDLNNAKISNLQAEINELDAEYWSSIEKYNEIKNSYGELSERLSSLKDELTQKWNDIIDQINKDIKEAWENIDFSTVKETNASILSGQSESDNKKEKDKQRRSENLQDLYKDVDWWAISYVDYDENINDNNYRVLENMLTEIKDQTNNKDIKNRAQEYLSLITMNKKIDANVDSINNVENKYNAVIANYKANNDDIIDLIQNDYDKFLVAVWNNDTTLVKDNSFDITLSTKLFDMDKDTIKALSNKENVVQKYMDYNMNNLQGYLNALENNSPETLNMDEKVYNLNKDYLRKIKDVSDEAYNIITNNTSSDEPDILLAQSAWWNAWNNWWNGNTTTNTVDIANYIDWYTLNTKEWSFLLANRDYINNFQSRFLLTDINKDGLSDLLLWDAHNIYIKYRNGYSNYANIKYNHASSYYMYEIESYEDLQTIADDWFVDINWIKVKLIDSNREVKNFKYIGQTFDTIKVSRSNSNNYGDFVDWYLIKMIHRVDQFNDKEKLMNPWNQELFDKKYILVLPEWSEITWMSLKVEEPTLYTNIENEIWTWDWKVIFSLLSYNESDTTINLTITDIPRNWQYGEIYTLKLVDDTYMIASSSSNQVVAWPQIIADDEWPNPTIKLYRPATDKVVSEWVSLEWFVWTNYILQVDWEDNVALDEIWIADELGDRIVEQTNISRQTGYMEYSWLYFTWTQKLSYYIGWIDINWNRYVAKTNLSIKVPTIEITNILWWYQNLSYTNGIVRPLGTSPIGTTPWINNNTSEVTIIAELSQDIDSGYVQFFRNRTVDKNTLLDRREKLNGNINENNQNNIPYFKVEPGNTEIYGWYFDIGNDIWLYSTSWDLVATINPESWKITVMNDFVNSVSVDLDYSPKRPIIKVLEWEKTIFWIIFSSIELVDIELLSDEVSKEPLESTSWLYWDFEWWRAILKDWEVIMYISPIWQIYTDAVIYGDYDFDTTTNSVIYTFKADKNWNNILWNVKVKIKNILED